MFLRPALCQLNYLSIPVFCHLSSVYDCLTVGREWEPAIMWNSPFCWFSLYTVSGYAGRHCQENRKEARKSYLLQDAFGFSFRHDAFPGGSVFVNIHKNRWLILIPSIGGCWQALSLWQIGPEGGRVHTFWNLGLIVISLHSLEMNLVHLGCRPVVRSVDQNTRAILPGKVSTLLNGTACSSVRLCEVSFMSALLWIWLFALSWEDMIPPGYSYVSDLTRELIHHEIVRIMLCPTRSVSILCKTVLSAIPCLRDSSVVKDSMF